MKTFRKGGIHPDACKLTAGSPTAEMPLPRELFIPLAQSIGTPAIPLVKAGDRVRRGDMLAKAGGFVSAPVHSPASGTVKKIEQIRDPQGFWQDVVRLETDETQEPFLPTPRTAAETEALSPQEIIAIVGEAGIVGLGGATFPTRVKLTVPEGKKADTVILNGAECEPYLTCDDRLMRERPEGIVEGLRLIMRAVSAPRGVIGIEENKPEAIEAMRAAIAGRTDMEVCVLRKKYPQGSEKQLIEAVTGKRVPTAGLPIDAGTVVDNVATAYAVYDAVCNRVPLTHRIVTVTGNGIPRAGNYLVAVGTPMSQLIEHAGGLPEDTGKIVAGGPMMGKAVSQPGAPAVKGLSGITLFSEKDSERRQADPCVRCAACVGACPMGLEPYLLLLQGLHSRWEESAAHGAMNCLECGCCSYVCPSSRPILDYIRLCKREIRKLPK